ncbi:MAG: CAP domain-containing protein [Candidatus Binataceae bacterium]
MKVGPWRFILTMALALAALALTSKTSRASDDWLARLNQYRAMAKLPAVAEDQQLSKGDCAHSRYVVKNYTPAIRADRSLGTNFHIEDTSNPWYTYDGFIAGRSSDVLAGTGSPSASWAIDTWIAAPFHRFALLNPHLSRIGYGSFCENGVCAAAVNLTSDALPAALQIRRRWSSGAPVTGESEARGGGIGAPFAHPIEFPPDRSVVDLLKFSSQEWPDPLTSCPGYKIPTGLSITLQLGTWLSPKISAWSLTSQGVPLETCAFDSDDYHNPQTLTQKLGRGGLEFYGAVVMIPRTPLKPDTRYTVSMKVEDMDYTWSFSTGTAAHLPQVPQVHDNQRP